jgi:hypothetical protein
MDLNILRFRQGWCGLPILVPLVPMPSAAKGAGRLQLVSNSGTHYGTSKERTGNNTT